MSTSSANRHRLCHIAKLTSLRLWLAICALTTLMELASAFGGIVDPTWWALPAMAAMTFPLWLAACAFTAVINIFVSRRMAAIQWLALLLSAGPISAVFPLNISFSNESNPASTLKLMTYNTFGFCDAEQIYPDGTNRIVTQIIHSDADVVFLQEVGEIAVSKTNHVTKAQVDSIFAIYPYHTEQPDKMLVILSKYPLTDVYLQQHDSPMVGAKAARMTFNGVEMLLLNLHLQSFGLNANDKTAYKSMTSGSRSLDWTATGHHLYSKLAIAFAKRAEQARLIRSQLDSIPHSNIIVAGDFNDIPLCHAMRVISDGEMHNGFANAGFGPTITYNSNRFYFNIDHILYGGDIAIRRMWHTDARCSDHFPVFATFTIPANAR